MTEIAPTGELAAPTVSLKEFGGPFKAMAAVWCSRLPLNLKAYAVALIQHANNSTGWGCTGQETLGRYLSLNDRSVRRLRAEFEEAWRAGVSPVRFDFRARDHSSHGYTVTVVAGALTKLARGPTGALSPVDSPSPTGATSPVEQLPTGDQQPPQPATGDRKAGVNRRSSAYKLPSTSPEVTRQTEEQPPSDGGSAAHAARAENPETTEVCRVCLGATCEGKAHKRIRERVTQVEARQLRSILRVRDAKGREHPSVEECAELLRQVRERPEERLSA